MVATRPPTRATGEAFLYSEERGLAAFEVGSSTSSSSSSKALVCVAGLTDGLLSLRYLPTLAEAVRSSGWRVFQPLLSSSYRGWGAGSLDEDAEELSLLLAHLAEHRGVKEVALLGHSTGAQDVVHFLKRYPVGSHEFLPPVCAAILQGGLSDREAVLATGGEEAVASVKKYREIASAMMAEGKQNEVMPLEASLLLGPPHPVTAYRFDSLTGRLTDDDMFSSDLTDEELQTQLGHMIVPSLVVLSADDEYMPSSIDPRAMSGRVAAAMAAGPMRQSRPLVLPHGGHGLSSPAAAKLFSEEVSTFLAEVLESKALQCAQEYGSLAQQLRQKAASKPKGQPLLVALAGVPGSGKSTLAGVFERLLAPACCVVPMDGYHVPLADLRQRPDAKEAEYRRGAPDTFDPASLRRALQDIKDASGARTVEMPGFDREAGDPTPPGDIQFDRQKHRIVLVEGLYLLHDADGWEGMADLFDVRLHLRADIDECISRVKERNKVIPGYTAEEIEIRCEKVDRANAIVVEKSFPRADMSVTSSLPAQ